MRKQTISKAANRLWERLAEVLESGGDREDALAVIQSVIDAAARVAPTREEDFMFRYYNDAAFYNFVERAKASAIESYKTRMGENASLGANQSLEFDNARWMAAMERQHEKQHE